MTVFLYILWLVSIPYATIPLFWLTIHPFADRWRAKRGRVMPLVIVCWVGCWVLAGVATWPLMPERVHTTYLSWLPALICFFAGTRIYRGISKDFDRPKVIGQAELKPGEHEQKLVVSGMHGRMRHPFYAAHLLMLTGFTLGGGLKAQVVLLGFALLTGWFMLRSEERELEQRFGDAYREYRKTVPALRFY